MAMAGAAEGSSMLLSGVLVLVSVTFAPGSKASVSLHLVSLAAYPTMLNAGRSASLSSGLRPGGAVGNFTALCFKTLECGIVALLAYHQPLHFLLAVQLLHFLVAVQWLNFLAVQVYLVHEELRLGLTAGSPLSDNF